MLLMYLAADLLCAYINLWLVDCSSLLLLTKQIQGVHLILSLPSSVNVLQVNIVVLEN